MIGPEGAASAARAWLTARIPARLRVLEERYSLPGGALADPAQVLDHEIGPLGLEKWPAVFVLPLRQDGMRLVDVREDSSEVYRVVYAINVLAWVRADSYATTDQLRKRYALAIREALLERKSLDPDTDETVVDPTSIREDYSDVMTDAAKRTIAGVSVTVNLIVTEVLEPVVPAYGVAADVDVDTVPAHPALD